MTDFEEVYTQHFSGVYRYAYSLCRSETVAEEVTQETFFKALKNLKKFDGRSSVFAWLCSIAKNTYINMCKKDKRIALSVDDDDIGFDFEDPSATPEQSYLTAETARELHRILHGLDEPYKEVFHLRTFGELSFAEIAELFDKSESWARVTYHRAKLKITEEMK